MNKLSYSGDLPFAIASGAIKQPGQLESGFITKYCMLVK
jgi:hypothetical protein